MRFYTRNFRVMNGFKSCLTIFTRIPENPSYTKYGQPKPQESIDQ